MGPTSQNTDQRVEQARQFSGAHQVPASHLRPSEMQAEIESLRWHLQQLLAVLGEPQAPGPVYPQRPMDTSDIDPETGECWEDGEH
jgi:hypothetical protein